MNAIPDDATGDALRLIQENGSDLTKPMEIDFFVIVPSEDAGNQIVPKIEELGFVVTIERDEETGDWTCYCAKTLVPEYAEIVKLENQLNFVAKPYDGYADGFGSYGNV